MEIKEKVDKRNNFWTYKDEQIHNKEVSNVHFIKHVESEVANLHPATPSYLSYWKDQKRYCIEGYWAEGKWMPGNIYFYINFCKIKIVNGKSRLVAPPTLRDLEWEKGYVFQESRGFSGFRTDSTTTCLLELENRGWGWKDKKTGETLPLRKEVEDVDYSKTHNKVTWVHPRNYMRTVHPENYSKPLYENQAFDVIDIECFEPSTEFMMGDLSKKKIKNIEVGDSVLGEDRAPKKVIDKFEGVNQLYRITTKLGTHIVSDGHLVKCYHKERQLEINVTELYFLNDGKYYIETLEGERNPFTVERMYIGDFVGITVEDGNLILHTGEKTKNCRRLGKSMNAGNAIILYNFLFNGATDYDEYLEQIKRGDIPTSETLVGAIDAKYTKDLLGKTQLGMDELRGGRHINGVWYPCPFYKKYRGSFAPSKYVEAAYEIKDPKTGIWVTKGCRSLIHNRSFGDNPLAGNGTGPNISCFEEVGFHYNLIETLGAMKDTTMADDKKFGTIYMFGTSGAMESGASEAAREVFMNPEQYDCLSFDNIWEEASSNKVGFFVPFQFRMAECRDKDGKLDFEQATKLTEAAKDKIKGNMAMSKHKQNNPTTPSEAFLANNNNCFPTADIDEHRKWLQSKMETDAFLQGQKGELVISGEKSEVSWKPNEKLHPAKYPVRKTEDNTGCIVIWEHPVKVDGRVPDFLYYGGTDPYDQDKADSTTSLGSTFIYKTSSIEGGGVSHTIVAEYTGRPERAKDHHENVRRLVEYYNAKLLYENNRNTIKFWFEQKNALWRFVKNPTIVKSLERSKSNNKYGVTMVTQVKTDLEELAADWLTEDRGDGKLNLHSIYSVPLLDELFYYNDVGNFDRVISFMLTICNMREHYRIKSQENSKSTKFADDDFFKGSKFNNI